MSACASRMPDSAVSPAAWRRAVLPARSALTCSIACLNCSTPSTPERPLGAVLWISGLQRHTGATTRPGAAAIPRRTDRGALLAKVAVDEVGKRRNGLVRVRPLGADRNRRPLADAEGQNAQHAFRVAHGAIFHDLDLRVLEPRGGLHEEGRRPRMQTDLVRDRERTFGDRLASPPCMP